MIELILLSAIALYLLYLHVTPSLPSNFPPGPRNYPFVGALPSIFKLDKFLPKALIKVGEKYGPITGCYFSKHRAVIINGHEMIKEVLTTDKFLGRPVIRNAFRPDKLGILFIEGEVWRVQRRFTLRTLRDWGFGKVSLESVIHDEIQECVKQMKSKMGENNGKIQIHNLFNISMVNIMWAITAGQRYEHDDPRLLEILAKINVVFRTGSPLGSLISDYPIFRYFPYFKNVWKLMKEANLSISSVIKDTIESHRNSRDLSSPRDFIDEYLRELEDNPDRQPTDPSFSLPQLQNICVDLFAGGSESTAYSIAFTILYSILYPEVQRKARSEILSVLGRDRLVSYTERNKLPYVEAVIAEVQRLSNIAPLTVPHAAMEDAELGGYVIPKGTMLTINLYSMHMSKDLWGDPQHFRPERFIDSEGKFRKSEYLQPFGMGKRACPGEPLARMNLFLFYVSLLQHFEFDVPPGEAKPTTEPLAGFTLAPKPFSSSVKAL